MSIDKSTLEHVAKLAMLDSDSSANEATVADMQRILELVEQLQGVDTQSAQPLFHPLELSQTLREDAITEDNSERVFLKLAQKTQDGLYLVPKVID